MFLAFLMATEPQSTPMPERAQHLFGAPLALLTFGLLLLGVHGGSVLALVILILLTPALDRISPRWAVGEGRRTRGG